MIINRADLLKAQPIKDMLDVKYLHSSGMSGGLTECGYDICLAQDVTLFLGRRFVLGSSQELFQMPTNLMGRVLNKSSWARRGIDASMTTNIEPAWHGYLTIELRYSGILPITIKAGTPIAQVIFEKISQPVVYKGKYCNQPNKPVKAK